MKQTMILAAIICILAAPAYGAAYGSYASYSSHSSYVTNKATTAAPASKTTVAPTMKPAPTTAALKAMTKVVKTEMTLTSFTVASFDAKSKKGVANGIAKTLNVDPLQVTIENVKAVARRLGQGAQRRLTGKGITFDTLIRVSEADAVAMKQKVVAVKTDPAALVANMNSEMQKAGSQVVIAANALTVATPATIVAKAYVAPAAETTKAPAVKAATTTAPSTTMAPTTTTAPAVKSSSDKCTPLVSLVDTAAMAAGCHVPELRALTNCAIIVVFLFAMQY
jgi:hypothetical protein